MNRNTKNILSWIFLIGLLFLIAAPFDSKILGGNPKEITYSQFIKAVSAGDVKEVNIRNTSSKVTGVLNDGAVFSTITPYDAKMVEKLLENGVEIKVESGDSGWGYLVSALIQWFPFLLLIGLMIYSARQMQGGGKGGGFGGGAFGIGKSKAKMFQPKKIKITFADVAGIDEAKQELEEIVDFLKAPQKYQRLGGKIPRGMLLVGDPGNGKTLLAKAIAGEAGVPFFSISGSDFVEVFVGVGASRVRDIFETAKKNSPCIIFIDEIDAVGRRRDSGRGGNDEREQTLNQLLVEMDGFDENQGVIVLAATNRADILDPALLRPGRFDRRITVQYPDMNGREKILTVHTKNVPLSPDVDLKTVARGTPGFSGAELANLVNEAALLAARDDKLSVAMKDFELAKDKVIMGAERKSMSMTDEEKRITAYHEAGHAIIALLVPQCDPIHKVTIIPRGGALGMVVRLPEKDKVSVTKTELLSNIRVSLGGRAAEEIFFGQDNITTGASSDLKQATDVAKKMVIKWGMSDKIGLRTFYDSADGYYLDASDQISQNTSETIDSEVKAIIEAAYAEVKGMITKHKKKLERMALSLLEHETLTGDEVKRIFEGKKLKRAAPIEDDLDDFKLGGLPTSDEE